MSRCKRTYGLEVQHKRPGKGNHLSNAVVLCGTCYDKRPFHGMPGPEPEPFTEATKELALRLAGGRCQCTSTRGCHTGSRAHTQPQDAEATET